MLSEHDHRWVTENIWPYIGAPVQRSITKLEGEGFTRAEATEFMEALTILQLYRMGYYAPPEWTKVEAGYITDKYSVAQIDSMIARGQVFYEYQEMYSEAQIESMLQRGVALPGWEPYEGFEGTR